MPATFLYEDEPAWLRTLIDYEPDTGLFRWKILTHGYKGLIHPGDVAGTSKDGYIQIKVGNCLWRAHRLAWVFMTGELPPKGKEVDHRDKNRANNRWGNLRLLTRSRNNHNALPAKVNKSGVRGVSWCVARQKWDARIWIDDYCITLGRFERFEDAVAKRREAETFFLQETTTMPEVQIVKAFTLTRDPKLLADDPTIPPSKYYPVGLHDMPEYDANHWYTAHHTENPPPSEPQPGTQAYAAKEARARARRTLVEAAIAQEAEDARKRVMTDARSSTRLADAEAEAHQEAEDMERERQEQEAANTAVQEGRRPPPAPSGESQNKPAVPQRRRSAPQGAASGEAAGDQNPNSGEPPPNTP